MFSFLHLILQGCVDAKYVSSKTNLVFANRLLYWLLVVLFDLGFASVNANGCKRPDRGGGRPVEKRVNNYYLLIG